MSLITAAPLSASSIFAFSVQTDLLQEICLPPTEAQVQQHRLLKGMIQAGQGRGAIAAILGLTADSLMQQVVDFGLPTPADLPLPSPRGPKCWALPDMQRLVALWTQNVTGVAIGAELGRSASGVYSKARSLGLYRRERTRLIQTIPAAPDPVAVVVDAICEKASGNTKRKEVRWMEAMEDELADRWFSMQHHKAIAADLGLSPTTVASKAHRLQLPKRNAKMLTHDFDVSRREKGLAMYPGIVRRRCDFTKKVFWGTRNGPRTSNYAKRELVTYAAACAVA